MLKMLKKEQTITFRTTERVDRKVESEKVFEKKWQQDPQQFSPYRNIETSLRLERCLDIVYRYIDLENAKVADLGCGFAEVSKKCVEKGAHITACDIADTPLKALATIHNLFPSKQWIPATTLEDHHFDLVLALDLIEALPVQDHRLFFSELARLVTKEGFILFSTSLDFSTKDPLKHLLLLAEIELEIHAIALGYHALWTRLYNGLNAISRLFNPLLNKKNLLKFLEKVTEFFFQEEGISHVLILAKRRPLMHIDQDEPFLERKTKKRVWE